MRRKLNLTLTKDEIEKEAEELIGIIDLPSLDSQTIWKITSRNFYEWRKQHDLPILINALRSEFLFFEEWQNAEDINDDFLLRYGISNCVESFFSPSPVKVVVEVKFYERVNDYVKPKIEKLHATYYNEPHDTVITIKKEFLGYFDWCKKNAKKEVRTRILSGYSNGERITLDNGFQLLKIGDIELQPSEETQYHAKYFEFADISGLKFKGSTNFVGSPLALVNCIGKNLIMEDFKGVYMHFAYTKIDSALVMNTDLQQTNFIFSDLNMEFRNSVLRKCFFHGRIFNIDLNETKLWEVDTLTTSPQSYIGASFYKQIKSIYSSQGDDAMSVKYFLLERESYRKQCKFKILKIESVDMLFQTFEFDIKGRFIYHMRNLGAYIAHSISYYFWGYGHKPLRVLYNAAGIIVLFSFIYLGLSESFHTPCVDDKLPCIPEKMDIWNCLYFSIVSFTTLGYGDFYLQGAAKLIAALEALAGATCLGFLVAGFANNKY